MNAYELADQVEMWGNDLLALNMKGGIPVTDGAKLIRQQADRIAELEKEVKELHNIAQVMAMQESDARKSLQNYKDGIK